MGYIVLVHRYYLERLAVFAVLLQDFLYVGAFIVEHHNVQNRSEVTEERFSSRPVAEMCPDCDYPSPAAEGFGHRIRPLEFKPESVFHTGRNGDLVDDRLSESEIVPVNEDRRTETAIVQYSPGISPDFGGGTGSGRYIIQRNKAEKRIRRPQP